MATELARRSCLFFLQRLHLEVGRLREISFPGHHPGPRKWLKFIGGAIDTARGYLDKAGQPGISAANAKELIQYAEILGGLAYEWLSHVAGADATGIPHQVVAPFQRWVDALNIGNTIFFRAEHLSNYEIWTFNAQNFAANVPSPAQSLIDATAAIDWPVLRVTVPSQSLGMLPHFAVVAHELGHAIQDSIVLDLTTYAAQEQDFFARVTARLADHKTPFGTAERLRCQEIADNWINEFKADAVGHTLVGPAFFFALAAYLELAGPGYGIAPTHPPSDLRLKTLLDGLNSGTPSFHTLCLSKMNLNLDLRVVSPNLAVCPTADELIKELSTKMHKTDAIICVELVSYMSHIVPSILNAAYSRISTIANDVIYSAADFERDIDTHLDLLVGMVPPIEYHDGTEWRAAGLASILNVGWAALLARLDRMPEVNPAAPDLTMKMERLHELLLKGVELSEARRQWQEHSR